LSRRYFLVPDVQIKPGHGLSHIDWAAQAIVDYRPDVIVVLGDWWDMHSLSTYETPGSKSMEGINVKADVDIGNEAFERLVAPMNREMMRRIEGHRKRWEPECHFLTGNHEQRIQKAIDREPKWAGVISLDMLKTPGFQRHDFLTIVELDGIKFCLAPHHRVLTSDLKWIALGDVEAGQELLAFDEANGDGSQRMYRRSIVEAKIIEPEETFDVLLSNGKVFTTTAEHLWLVRHKSKCDWKWLPTSKLTSDYSVQKLTDTWEEGRNYESGYLAGILDGEGCLSYSNTKCATPTLSFAQKSGVVLDTSTAILDKMGIEYSVGDHSSPGVKKVNVLGGMAGRLKLIGITQAARILEKFKTLPLGVVQRQHGIDPVFVVSVTPAGVQDVAKVQTSTGTMIADGYAHHNCHFFPNPYTGKAIGGTIINRLNHIGASFVQGHQQGFLYASKQFPDHVKHGLVAGRFYQEHESYRSSDVQKAEWSGCVVLNEVRNGSYDLMPLSMDYLRRTYG
jgi:hypothetical protein